jgi:Ni,Fe-hydrogenase maturation factor
LYKLVHSKLKNIKIVLGGSAPEKSLSQITAYKPDTVIMVNAVERKLLPGDVVIEDLREDHGSFPLMHKFPLSVLAQLITLDLGESTEVRLLGVQAKRLYGKVSKQVFETTASLARALIECDGLAVEAG